MAEKNLVIIKSFKNGLRLIIDKNAPFQNIISELAEKCSEGRSFFGNSITAISIEGKELTEDEEVKVIETINENCDLNVICIVGKDTPVNDSIYINAIELMQSRLAVSNNDNECTIYRGSLKDGDSIKTINPVIILGDVASGCTVSSAESITVLGGLYGEAVINKNLDSEDDADNSPEDDFIISIGSEASSGTENENSNPHFIIALDMMPERLEINGVIYRSDKVRTVRKHKACSKTAYVKNGKLIIDDLSKSVLETVYAL